MTAAAEDRDRVGPYRVIQAIGAGGSARIDLARIDRAYGFQRHVVLKRPLEHLRGDPGVAASLRREARIGGQLRHPNLVAILDAGIHDGYDYLVLEYVHGAALRTVMQGDAPGQVRDLPLGVALAIVADAARGMHEAHELSDEHGAPLGLVHRDVSPANILLGLDGTAKLADFGIAKETRVATLSGAMHGTVTYMAPEQCRGHAFDRRADVFSLGVILYELVTGVRLFWADNDVASLHRVLSGAVPRPRTVKPQIPGALEDIVMTAIAHDAERRFATALELATGVERYAASAGEVLGARWIARTVEAVVGPRAVPWIAAAAAAPEVAPSEVAPSGDGSLVDLIAATDGDEPVEPGFGAPGGAGDAVAAAADAADAADAPRPAPRDEAGRAAGSRRRARSRMAAIAAIGAIGGAAAIAVVMTRGPGAPPAIPAPAAADSARVPPPARAASPANARGPVEPAARPPAGDSAPPDDRGHASEVPRDVAGEPAARAAAADPAATAPPASRDRPTRASAAAPPARPTAGGRRRHPADPPRAIAAPAATGVEPRPAAAAPPAPGAGSAAVPPAPPAARVEWKPTLLLPTDGSEGSARR